METYIKIYDWMQNAGLRGLTLMVYALIYQMSETGKGCYFGGYDNLAKRTFATKRNCITAVNNLVKQGAVIRQFTNEQGHRRTILFRNPEWADKARQNLVKFG